MDGMYCLFKGPQVYIQSRNTVRTQFHSMIKLAHVQIFRAKELEKGLSCLVCRIRKVGPTASSDLLKVTMLTLIQHVINDSFASFLRCRQIVQCAYENLPSGLKPLLPQLLGILAVGSSQLFLSRDLPWAAESLFAQGQLPCDEWAAWLMQRNKGLVPAPSLPAPVERFRVLKGPQDQLRPRSCIVAQFLPLPMLLPSLPSRY